MAKAQIKMPEELLVKLSRLGKKSDEIAAMVLRKAAEWYSKKCAPTFPL